MDFLSKYAPQIQGLLRIMTALLFLSHGTNKLFNFPMSGAAHPHVAWNLMTFPWGPAGIIEVVAGTLIVLGLFSRWAAFIASGECAVAYFVAHAPQSFFPFQNEGDAAVLFSFIFLFIAAAGPGAWAFNQK